MAFFCATFCILSTFNFDICKILDLLLFKSKADMECTMGLSILVFIYSLGGGGGG